MNFLISFLVFFLAQGKEQEYIDAINMENEIVHQFATPEALKSLSPTLYRIFKEQPSKALLIGEASLSCLHFYQFIFQSKNGNNHSPHANDIFSTIHKEALHLIGIAHKYEILDCNWIFSFALKQWKSMSDLEKLNYSPEDLVSVKSYILNTQETLLQIWNMFTGNLIKRMSALDVKNRVTKQNRKLFIDHFTDKNGLLWSCAKAEISSNNKVFYKTTIFNDIACQSIALSPDEKFVFIACKDTCNRCFLQIIDRRSKILLADLNMPNGIGDLMQDDKRIYFLDQVTSEDLYIISHDHLTRLHSHILESSPQKLLELLIIGEKESVQWNCKYVTYKHNS